MNPHPDYSKIAPENLPRQTLLLRGMRGRCPRCESPDIYRSAFRLRERCPKCNLPLEMEDGWSYGSVPLAYSLACVVWVMPLALLFILGLLSLKAAIAISIVGVLILPIATFRFTKSLWVGLYYAIVRRELRVRAPGDSGDEHS